MPDKQAGKSDVDSGCVTESRLATDAQFIDLVKKLSDELGFAGNNVKSAEVEDLSGNINRVRRVRLWLAGGQTISFVIKHVPEGGKLEKYPSIVFPENRLSFEVLWFDLSKRVQHGTSVKTPTVLHFSKDQHTVIMEDLAPLCSLGGFLRQIPERKADNLLPALGGFLAFMHRASIDSVEFSNPGAALNRPYVFRLPLEKPAQMQAIWRQQAEKSQGEPGAIDVREKIRLQELYLRNSDKHVLPVLINLERTFKDRSCRVLTHGDLHTDSILVLQDRSLGVVDAELCDFGSPAFDLGMLCAHIWACTVSGGLGDAVLAARLAGFLDGYFGSSEVVAAEEKQALLHETAMHSGAEILRRLLGAAGFPFALTGEQFEELLEKSTQILLSPAELCQKMVYATEHL